MMAPTHFHDTLDQFLYRHRDDIEVVAESFVATAEFFIAEVFGAFMRHVSYEVVAASPWLVRRNVILSTGQGDHLMHRTLHIFRDDPVFEWRQLVRYIEFHPDAPKVDPAAQGPVTHCRRDAWIARKIAIYSPSGIAPGYSLPAPLRCGLSGRVAGK